MNADRLLGHYEQIADAPDAVQRLRRFILDLALRGKLVKQDPNDEPASELLKKIAAEKERLVKVGEIKKQSALPLVATYEALFSVPNVWKWTRIGSAAYVEMGQSPPSEHYNRTGHGIPFFQGKADFGKRYPTARYWCTQPKKYAAPGDILISVRAPVGPTNVASEPCCIGRGLAALRSHNGIDRYYLLRCLEAFEHALAALGFGTTFVAINKNQLTAFVIPLPPLAEQRRIVAKVDELMALCDRLEKARAAREATRNRMAAASLFRLNDPDPDPLVFRNHAAFALENLAPLTTRTGQIKALRQTILNLAVHGKLVRQNPADEPASELLKWIAAEKARLMKAGKIKKTSLESPIFPNNTPFSLPTGWAWSTLGWICSKTGSGSTPRGGKKAYKPSGVVFLRSQNVHDYGLRLSDAVYIDRATHERMSGTAIETSDLLLNITGGSIGRCCLVPDGLGEANISQHVAIIRTATNGPQQFMHCLVLSPYFQDFISNEQTGAGRGGLPKNKMDRIPVPLPPLAEQHRIVAKVDGLMALCDRLEAALATSNDTRLCLLDALLNEVLPARRLRGHLTKREKLVH